MATLAEQEQEKEFEELDRRLIVGILDMRVAQAAGIHDLHGFRWLALMGRAAAEDHKDRQDARGDGQ